MPVSLDFETYDLAGLTWEECETAIPEADVVILPCGSIEQHGPHLPLAVDTLRAENLSRELVLAGRERGLDIKRLPTLPYGYSEHHLSYSGTITLSASTYQNVIEEIGESIVTHKAAEFLLMNCHGGNREPLSLAIDRLQRDHELPCHLVHWTDYARDELEERFGTDWGHAGEHETSVIELFHPKLVRNERKEPQRTRNRFDTRKYAYFDDITKQGGLGDPTAAEPEFIANVIEDATERILDGLEEDLGALSDS